MIYSIDSIYEVSFIRVFIDVETSSTVDSEVPLHLEHFISSAIYIIS